MCSFLNKPILESILVNKNDFIGNQPDVERLKEALNDVRGVAFEYIRENDTIYIVWKYDNKNIWFVHLNDFLEIIEIYSKFEFYITENRKSHLDITYGKKLNPNYKN